MSTRPSVQQVRTRYAFIQAHRKRYSVQSMCRELGVAQSGYYAWLKQPISSHDQEGARLLRAPRHREHLFHAIVITHSTAS
jgi:transposase-like protein